MATARALGVAEAIVCQTNACNVGDRYDRSVDGHGHGHVHGDSLAWTIAAVGTVALRSGVGGAFGPGIGHDRTHRREHHKGDGQDLMCSSLHRGCTRERERETERKKERRPRLALALWLLSAELAGQEVEWHDFLLVPGRRST